VLEPGLGGSWENRDVLVLTPVPTHPVTLGNRGRIFQVCQALKRRGAHVHLLHYPSDDAWRRRLPHQDHRAMVEAWDAVFLAPVTRPLHTGPDAGRDHSADAWWDPAIGQMLDWLFRTGSYDACIVNYTWLSRALDHCPPGVLRILDTHDRFTGRRELLESHGIPAEFFHLTEEQERLALRRADLVWAIKEQEEAFFRKIAGRPCLTLPHAEPLAPVPNAAPSPGVLRLGIVGGRNHINRVNIRAFLKVAHEYLRRTLLPVEILVAGSICGLLEDLDLPFLRKLGIVDSMDELYGQVDVVLAPLEFSTGLKIKVGEALARGKPLVSHAHAFEGYAPRHPFHACPSFLGMMRAVHQIVRDSALLPVLARASEEALAEAATRVAAALDGTAAHLDELRRSFVFVLPGCELHAASLVFDNVVEAAGFLAFKGPVAFLATGPLDAAEAACCAALRSMGPLLAEPEAARRLGARSHALFGRRVAPQATLARLMQGGHLGFWFADLPPAAEFGPPVAAPAWLPVGVLAQTMAEAAIVERARRIAPRFPALRILDAEVSALAAAVAAAAGVPCGPLLVPGLRTSQKSAVLGALRDAAGAGVAVFCDDPAGVLTHPVIELLARTLGQAVDLVHGEVGAAPHGPPRLDQEGPVKVRTVSGFARDILHRGKRPLFVVDLARGGWVGPWREAMLRAGVPRLVLGGTRTVSIEQSGGAVTDVPGLGSLGLTALALIEGGESAVRSAVEAQAALRFGADAGWAKVWVEASDIVRRAGSG
jgi:hypothetical protein